MRRGSILYRKSMECKLVVYKLSVELAQFPVTTLGPQGRGSMKRTSECKVTSEPQPLSD